MAKDGTRRGGARAGAGRKPKALVDKVNEGEAAKVMDNDAGVFFLFQNKVLFALGKRL